MYMGQTLDRQLARAKELVLPICIWDRPLASGYGNKYHCVTHMYMGQTAVVSTNNERYEIAQKDELQV